MLLKRFLMIRGVEMAALLALAMIPLAINNPFVLGLLTLLAIYGILLIGLDVTVGYLGQVNLGQAAFLGIGAYAAGLATVKLGVSLQLNCKIAVETVILECRQGRRNVLCSGEMLRYNTEPRLRRQLTGL